MDFTCLRMALSLPDKKVKEKYKMIPNKNTPAVAINPLRNGIHKAAASSATKTALSVNAARKLINNCGITNIMDGALNLL